MVTIDSNCRFYFIKANFVTSCVMRANVIIQVGFNFRKISFHGTRSQAVL